MHGTIPSSSELTRLTSANVLQARLKSLKERLSRIEENRDVHKLQLHKHSSASRKTALEALAPSPGTLQMLKRIDPDIQSES